MNTLKHLWKIFILFFLILNSGLNAQSDSLLIGLETLTQSGQVLLRWAPMNEYTFNWCNKYGYTLSRYIIKENGQSLTYQQMQASKVILMDSIGPVSDTLWDSKDTSDLSLIAAGAIYGDKFKMLDADSASMNDKMIASKERSNRYTFGLYAADQDISVASMMALAYTDTTIQQGVEYLYEVRPAKQDTTVISINGIKFLHSDSISNLQGVANVDYFVQESQVTLFWSNSIPGVNYSGYFIERSMNGGPYTRLNSKPHTSLTNEINPYNILYQDLIPDTINEYWYRIIGYSPFGIEGGISNVAKIKATKERKNVIGYIDKVEEQSNGSMKLEWVKDQGLISDITGWKIFRAPNPDSPYVLITPNTLPTSQTDFIDPNPFPYTYYKVVAVDVNGYEHPSIMKLAQKADSIPPAIPMGLVGTGYTTGEIILQWSKNTEKDLLGYRVFISNFPTVEYAEISHDVVSDTTFSYYIALDNLSKNIYFKITSLDERHNESDYSPWILVKRPDIIPPDAANLFSVNPTYNGAALSFIMSASNDVTFHRIQRKEIYKNFWVSLNEYVGLRPNDNEFVFVDTTASFRKTYDYRIAVYDDASHITYSKVFRIKPLPPPIRGNIFNITTQVIQQTGLILNSSYYANLNKEHFKNIIIEWEYDLIEDIEEFVIYRKVGNGPMVTLRTVSFDYWQSKQGFPGLSGNKFFFIDDDLLVKRSYLIALANAGGNNGGGSQGGGSQGGGSQGGGSQGGGSQGGSNGNSTANQALYGNDTYIYQIKCKHKDGSMSNPSSLITINL